MAVLFLLFALAMGVGTFIEDAYNTETARVYIYNAKWFEAIMIIFVFNFFGNIKRYQLNKKEKWATLLLHLSFILIIAGAFVTRYISFEGMMPIREGEAQSHFYSDKPYLTVFIDGEYQGEVRRRTFEKQLLLSSATMPIFASNDFSISDKFSDIPFEIEYKDFKLGAKEVIKEGPNGVQYIKMVEQSGGQRHDHYLKEGEVQSINNLLFAFNKPTDGAINVVKTGDTYTITTPFEGTFMRMADKMQGDVVKDAAQQLMFRSLYNLQGAMSVFPERAIKGKVAYEGSKDFKTKEDAALTVTVKSEGLEKEVTLLGGWQKMGVPVSFKQGKLEYTLMYGSKTYELPFAIRLNDFIAEKYPGTESSYASFESKVTVEDKEEKNTINTRIYMNHVLDYRGYRFFQSGFDPDEKGTKLSVNHDFWGTWISYSGYFLLYFGLMAILFDKNTRFGDLKVKLDKIKAKKASLTAILLLMFSLSGFSQTDGHQHHDHEHDHEHEAAAEHNHVRQKPTQKQLDSVIQAFKVSPEHAAKFSRIVIQDFGGRMKPVNTFASELLRKVSKSDVYGDMNADQTFLSMAMLGEIWYDVPIIALERGNDSIRKIAGLEKGVKFAAMSDFFDNVGNYKLGHLLEDAYREKVPNKFQTDFINLDKRINLLNWAISGQILKVLPIPNDEGNKWVSFPEAAEGNYKGLDTIRNIVPYYFGALSKATHTKDYNTAESILEGLSKYQQKAGAAVMPSQDKIDAELLYNKYDIFKKLYSWYLYAGLLMFLFTIIKIFKENKGITLTVKFFHGVVFLLFILHTLGLATRWYISGHAPWSNAYESVIYVAWATMFFGLAFGRKSELTVASTAFVVFMVLMVAHWSWTDAEIANLVPVLNSYWLMIHVAVIVGCYGPFTLGMILGLVSLILMLFTNKNNKVKLDLNIKELTYINEMALTVGLVMLSIGNFLGGQWANESWGRYWGWDPKETWALVSIMVYAFVIHMRFVPALRGTWIFNFFSVLAFAAILMTYFGVNFYLTGLHSYASGEVRTPMYFFYMAIGVAILGVFSNIQYRRHFKKQVLPSKK